jgi:hypothetical protein
MQMNGIVETGLVVVLGGDLCSAKEYNMVVNRAKKMGS